MYLFGLYWVLAAAPGSSLAVAGGGCSLVAVCRLPVAVASSAGSTAAVAAACGL